MENNEVLHAILSELKTLNGKVNNLEVGQQVTNDRLINLEAGQRSLEAGQKSLEAGQKSLEAGQKVTNDRLI
ncbi:MAG: hydrolase, partial [Clostridia bacterium]